MDYMNHLCERLFKLKVLYKCKVATESISNCQETNIDIWLNVYSPHHAALSFHPPSPLPFTAKFLGRAVPVCYPLFLSPFVGCFPAKGFPSHACPMTASATL